MSASERLRELDGALHFDTPTDRATFVKGRDAEHAILRALPLIADVAEAAERSLSAERNPRDLQRELRQALTRLEDHLDGN